MKVSYPKQYSKLIEEKIINFCDWKISEIPEVMISGEDSIYYENFYNLFFPIFSETESQNKMNYEKYNIYLINFSKNNDNIFFTKSKSPKIIYFANNSNAKIKFKNTEISLIDKKGISIFVDADSEIELVRSTNIQTCIVILNLSNIKTSNEKLLYK